MIRLTPDESATVLRLFAEGYARTRIAEIVNRPRGTVNSHITHHAMTPEQREKRRQQKNEARRWQRENEGKSSFTLTKDGFGTGAHREFPSIKPPAEIIAERDLRFSRPFNIRNDILGEPEPGRSALDKKMAGMPA